MSGERVRLNLLLRSNNGSFINLKMLQTEVLCYLHCEKSRDRTPWQLFMKAPTEWRSIIVLPVADSSSLSLPRPRINGTDDRLTSDLVNPSVLS